MKIIHSLVVEGAGRLRPEGRQAPFPVCQTDLALRPTARSASTRRSPLSTWNNGRARVWLPGPSGSSRHSHDSRDTAVSLCGLRVLLVDDSIETLEAFSALLALEGAIVHTAADGLAALRLCDQHGFDLVLSDLGMPRMDGYAFIEALRRRPETRRVTAFALSGFGDCGVERALACGYQAYLAKPVTLEALREAISRHPPATLCDTSET